MKAKKEQKPLTIEEKRKRAWNNRSICGHFASFGAPTYGFDVGDSVVLGGLKNTVVDDIKLAENGDVYYGVTYEDTRNGQEGIGYMYAPWYDIRPTSIREGTTSFTQDDKISISFYNQSIESLLSRYYLSGVDMDPSYQRDYVWDDKDKEALLDSIFSRIEIGKFAFIARDYTHEKHFEILDGKQRLSTLLEFYENRLPYRGVYYNDLSPKDRHTFLQANVTVGETGNLTNEQICKYFYTLNKAGRTMDKEHLEKVVSMIGESSLDECTYDDERSI